MTRCAISVYMCSVFTCFGRDFVMSLTLLLILLVPLAATNERWNFVVDADGIYRERLINVNGRSTWIVTPQHVCTQ